MGHVRATYAREILPSIHLATRYEVNLNDLHSRTAGGIELRPSSTFPYLLRAKYDTQVRGIAHRHQICQIISLIHFSSMHLPALQEGLGLSIGHKMKRFQGAWMLGINYDRSTGPHVGLSFHF